MQNRRYFPFERNSFYPGKLLTARDFEAEQRYMNDKRRLMNRLFGGSGIVAGLGVIMADDASVILQAGCALDASGREIVVPETRVIKLPTVEGYDRLTSNCAYLGISYGETPEEEVYSVMSDENGAPRFNKLAEGYKLTLTDESMAARVPRELDEFVNRVVIYAAEDVEAALLVPACLPRESALRVRFTITRQTPGTGEYSFSCRLGAPGFQTGSGAALDISADKVKLSHGEQRSFDYLLRPEPYLWGGGAVTLAVENFAIRRGDEEFTLNRRMEAVVKPVDQTLDAFYLSACYGRPMDKQLTETFDERLWIAKLLLLRRGSSIIVDRVLPPPFGQYSYNAQQLMLLRELEEYYPAPRGEAEAPPAGRTAEAPAVSAPEPGGLRSTACGVFNLSLGLGADQKGPAFSEEIMHGLGKGPVYVDVGVEYIDAASEPGGSGEILLGNVSLFKSDAPAGGEERIYNLSTAVKVLPERGTFVVAVNLEKPTGLISLRIRWFAFRLGELSKQLKPQDRGERMLMLNPDTIVLAPKAAAHLSPVFVNMPSEACTFRVMDPEGGTVDQNGLYTAPAREGAYEVRVEAVSDPTIYTHAFMIVTQKKKEE